MLPLVFALLLAPEPPQVDFDDFQSPARLSLIGSAGLVKGRLRLTPAYRQLSGAAWLMDKQPLQAGFETHVRFQLTATGGLGQGADGFAFVIQNSGPEALAGRGSAGGFAVGDGQGDRRAGGIPFCLAVFFDTHRNDDANDPSDNFVVVATNGHFLGMRWPPPRLGMSRRMPIFLKDGKEHTARIVFQPPVLSVYLDHHEKPVVTVPIDLRGVVDQSGKAWIGFTASTGNGYENHDILSWRFRGTHPTVESDLYSVSSSISFISAACLPDRNLCTPEEPVVESTGPRRYHVVLPAHLAWGASLPNPENRAGEITNARGKACWDLDKLGAAGCTGPEGEATGAGKLIWRQRNGRMEFSIDERSSAGFKDNQGYYEFDVELK